jgi:hypothetical protein
MSDRDKADLKDANFATGAVRSADVDHLDFASAPLLGLLGVLRVAGCGGTKYGRLNYMKGMPVHVTLNHVAVHLIKYLLGDRSEDHLSKVAWGAMVANQTAALQPELADPHLLGPGATVTPAVAAEMERGKAERDARRQAGEFEALFRWTLAEMPEFREILDRRLEAAHRAVMGHVKQSPGVTLGPDVGSIEMSRPEPVAAAPGAIGPLCWEPFSPANITAYGKPTRTEWSHQRLPNPRPDETWIEFGNGQRAYYPRRGRDGARWVVPESWACPRDRPESDTD